MPDWGEDEGLDGVNTLTGEDPASDDDASSEVYDEMHSYEIEGEEEDEEE